MGNGRMGEGNGKPATGTIAAAGFVFLLIGCGASGQRPFRYFPRRQGIRDVSGWKFRRPWLFESFFSWRTPTAGPGNAMHRPGGPLRQGLQAQPSYFFRLSLRYMALEWPPPTERCSMWNSLMACTSSPSFL